MIIDLSTARLDYEDILASYGLYYFDPSFSNRKFSQQHFGWGYTEVVANGLCKLGVGAAAQDDNVSNHYDKQAGNSWVVRLIAVGDKRITG